MSMRRLIANPLVRRFLRAEEATTAMEYAIIASGISIVIVGAVTTIGSELKTNFYDKLLAMF
jgi:pilus assembly protein Flp/PilA